MNVGPPQLLRGLSLDISCRAKHPDMYSTNRTFIEAVTLEERYTLCNRSSFAHCLGNAIDTRRPHAMLLLWRTDTACANIHESSPCRRGDAVSESSSGMLV